MTPANLIFFFLGGLLGSIPSGVLVSKLPGGIDPRESGSGNIGATNVLRTSGITRGTITLMGDILKGSIAVAMVSIFAGPSADRLFPQGLAAIGAVLGHMYSPFLGFQGGKGVATGLGAFFYLMPGPVAWAAIVFAAVVALTRYISLGSILGVLTMPVAGIFFGYTLELIVIASLTACLIVWRHKSNIQRLLRGEENRIGQRENGA